MKPNEAEALATVITYVDGLTGRYKLREGACIERPMFNENHNTFDWLNEIATPLVLGIIKTSCIVAII